MESNIVEPDRHKLDALGELPLRLGFHAELIKEIYKALHYYSLALDGQRIGLSILRVNPLVSNLHSCAIRKKSRQGYSGLYF